ncbi:MAG TPA: hypothetical protein VKO67_06025 [Smithellaceae bacterium]|nr:hypothetical protein [Smithellaceae bacterium]
MKARLCVIFLILPLLLFTGCASIGPATVSRDRFDYASSITESWKRQTLLNIVKIRYIEPLFFVDVGQIVSGYTLETGLSLGASDGKLNSFVASSISAGVSGKYTDRPTITYTPLTGPTFVRSVMTPISPAHLLFAVQSGVPADMIFKLGVASINGLRNDSATVDGYIHANKKYLRVVELMRRLQLAGAVNIKMIRQKDNQENAFVSFQATGNTEISLQVKELREILGLDGTVHSYRLIYGNVPESNREIAMQTFSVMHMLASLSARVDVPLKDVAEKRASPGIREMPEALDREGGFLIKSSGTAPQDAYVSVKYRDAWFWIDDKDQISKRAISVIVLILSLADTGSDKPLPLVTIPAQ